MGKHFDRAEILYEQQRYDLAITELQQELAIDPDDGDAYCLWGRCLTAQKKYEEALIQLKQAIYLEPERSDFYHALSHYYLMQDILEKAMIEIKEAIRLNPQEPQHIFCLAAILYEEGKQWEHQTSLDRKISDLFNPHAQNDRAVACWESALNLLAESRQLNPEEINYVNLQTILLEKLNRSVSANRNIEEAISLNPENPIALKDYGWLLLQRGEYIKSTSYFRDALRIAPNLEPAKNGLLEALRSRLQIYRWVSATHKIPNTNFSLAQLSIALFFGSLLMSFVFLGVLQPILKPYLPSLIILIFNRLSVLIGLFSVICCLASLVAPYMFNWFLQFNDLGRQILTQVDIIRSSILGVAILTGIGFIIVAFFSPVGLESKTVRERLFFIEMCIGIGLLPIAVTPSVDVGKCRKIMAIYVVMTWVFGLTSIALKIGADRPLELFGHIILSFYFLTVLLSPLIAIHLRKNWSFDR
jgi:tetratricopeptide (TPR) repeat protein